MTIATYVPEPIGQHARKLASSMGISASELLRRALEAYLVQPATYCAQLRGTENGLRAIVLTLVSGKVVKAEEQEVPR